MLRRFALPVTALLALLAPFALLAPAHAAPGDDATLIRIASGRTGLTYRTVYARNLEHLLRGHKFVYLASEGSGQNLDLLADGKADVAFAQADVYAEKLAADGARYGVALPVGRIAPECVFLARRDAGSPRTLGELSAKASSGQATVAVGDAASGMAGTWAYMQRLVPGLAAVKLDHTAGTLALNQLAIGRLDAVGWVSDPDNADQKLLRAALANDELGWLALDDPALEAALPDGLRVYEKKSIKVGDGLLAEKLATICTSAMLFVRRDADPKLVDKLADVVSLQRDQLAPRKK